MRCLVCPARLPGTLHLCFVQSSKSLAIFQEYRTLRTTHIGTALLLIALSLIGLFWIVPTYTTPATAENDISPAFVPSLALCVIGGYSLILLISALKLPAGIASELDDEFGAEATGVDRRVLLNTLILCAVSALTWLLINFVGFEPAAMLLVAAIMLYVGVRNWIAIGLTAVVAPIVLSLCTYYFFSTQLPGFWK